MKTQCALCEVSIFTKLQEHHIKPRANRGTDEPRNLLTVCANCHVVLTVLMGKLDGQVPKVGEIRHMANTLHRFATILRARGWY